jgi:hypothetical protein
MFARRIAALQEPRGGETSKQCRAEEEQRLLPCKVFRFAEQ